MLTLVTWLVLLIYVDRNEKQLIEKISTLVRKRTHGDVSIGGLSVSFFRTFPILSLQLKKVVVRDSLYSFHKQDLLNVSDIYLRASIPGIVSRKVPVGKVVIRNGSFNLFTDTTGITNEYVLKSESGNQENKTFEMPDLELQNIAVNYQNTKRKKHYQATVKSMHCAPSQRQDRLRFKIKMNMHVQHLAFNTITGSYLQDKWVNGKFDLEYALKAKQIDVSDVKLFLDGHPYYFTGFFNLNKNKADFKLRITGNKVVYTQATGLLRGPLKKRMNEYSISRPINMQVNVAGKTNDSGIPLVVVYVEVKDSKVGTPLGAFDECSFKGVFNNEMIPGKGKTDENSLIHLTEFSGNWENILVRSKNIRISNLINTFLDCDVKADADLKSLNSLAGSASIQFAGGKSSVDILFKGPIVGEDTSASTISGNISVYHATMKYLPRNFTLSDFNGALKFENNDLVVSELKGKTGSTQLLMKGSAKNFLAMLDKSPEKLVLNWTITSPALHLEDFKPFLSRSSAASKEEKKRARFASAASKIDKLFAEGDMYIQLRTPSMDYKTFEASNVQADVVLKTSEIGFDKVNLNHAGGNMQVQGSLKNGEKSNPVQLHAQLTNMDIPRLFKAFNNFGQDAITSENLSGKLSANVEFYTSVDNQADLIGEANEGTVTFNLENGELINFAPLMEVSKKAFKKQDFSHIRFADLKNRLEIKGSSFIVNEMDIRSTALNLTVEGIYDLKKGTDMSIRLPLTNLTKSQADTDLSDEAKAKRGVSLRLRARTGDDGKLKVSWDPFRRSKKKKEEIQDSSSVPLNTRE